MTIPAGSFATSSVALVASLPLAVQDLVAQSLTNTEMLPRAMAHADLPDAQNGAPSHVLRELTVAAWRPAICARATAFAR